MIEELSLVKLNACINIQVDALRWYSMKFEKEEEKGGRINILESSSPLACVI